MAAVRSKALDALRRLNSVASVPTTASYRSLYGAVASQSTFTGASNVGPTTPSAPQGAAFSTRAAKIATMDDADVVKGILAGEIKQHNLEKYLKDPTRAAIIRRKWTEAVISATPLGHDAGSAVHNLPVESFNTDVFYKSIEGTNCENVIGYIPYPVGVIGPVKLDGKDFFVPMATTEGALLASANRGARAIAMAGGATTILTDDGMTRAPLLRMPNAKAATDVKRWVEDPANFELLRGAFNSTTRFGKLKSIAATTAGHNVYVRFVCFTGDAMGMNMITKGVSEALTVVQEHFPAMRLLALSGNLCTDKKPSAINWLNGRGKSVTCEVHLTKEILSKVLKTNADALVELNTAKNLVGSAMAGSIGGFNAHASNLVTAVYLATGQDPAQNVESSSCITLFDKDEEGTGVYASVTMPSIEVGTVGGGTSLPAQSAALAMMGVKGASRDKPGSNSQQLARIVAGAVLAGELSLMAALTSGDLLSAHINLNRKVDTPAASPAGSAAPGTSAGASFSTATPAGVAATRARGRASVHPHGGVGGGVGAFKVPTAGVAPGRRFFAAPRATDQDLDFDGHETPRLTVP